MSESSRFRSLEGILAKPPAKRPPLHAVETDDPDQARQVDPAPPSEPAPRATPARTGTGGSKAPAPTAGADVAGPATSPATGRRRGTTAASRSTGGTRRVAFRLSEDLARRLSERVTLDGTSQAHVVLDAVETAHGAGTLTDLVAAQQRPAAGAGTLFARPAIRGSASASVATEIRLDAGTLAVLDDLVASTGADTRTQLIVAALDAHLG